MSKPQTTLTIEHAGATIVFERELRNCPFNQTHALHPSQLIYDWRVTIDGEHRAQIIRESAGRGYRLYDADRRPIHYARAYSLHLGEHISTRARFADEIRFCLDNGKIPTLAELERLRRAEALAEAQKAAVEQARQRLGRKRQCGPELFDALRDLADFVEAALDQGQLLSVDGKRPEVMALQRAREELAKAEEVQS